MRLKTGILAAILPLSLAVTLCPFSSAYADYTTYEPYALEFLETLGNDVSESGLNVNNTNELVVTMANAASVKTGVNLVNNVDGSLISYSGNLTDNLASFKYTDGYPGWAELTDDQKATWHNDEANYNAARFNSMLGAFGLDDAKSRYYGSGGGSFDLSEDEQGIVGNILDVAEGLETGAGVIGSAILGLFDDDSDEILSAILGVNDTITLHGSERADWPQGLPDTLNVTVGVYNAVNYTWSNHNRWLVQKTSTTIYFVPIYYSGSLYNYVFDKDGFVYAFSSGLSEEDPNRELSRNPTNEEVNGISYYYAMHSVPMSSNIKSTKMPINFVDTFNTTAMLTLMAQLVSDGTLNHVGKISPDIEGYPTDQEQINGVIVYAPTGGITNSTKWVNYTEKSDNPDNPDNPDDEVVDLSDIIELLQRFKFYATGQLKVHDEGVYDSLTDIGLQLDTIIGKLGLSPDSSNQIQTFEWGPFQTKSQQLGEELENLAPFGAIFLVSNLVETVSEIAVVSEPKLTIPFKFFTGHDQNVVIDVSWIDEGRPVINVFVILSLMLSLAAVSIRFIEIEVG